MPVLFPSNDAAYLHRPRMATASAPNGGSTGTRQQGRRRTPAASERRAGLPSSADSRRRYTRKRYRIPRRTAQKPVQDRSARTDDRTPRGSLLRPRGFTHQVARPAHVTSQTRHAIPTTRSGPRTDLPEESDHCQRLHRSSVDVGLARMTSARWRTRRAKSLVRGSSPPAGPRLAFSAGEISATPASRSAGSRERPRSPTDERDDHCDDEPSSNHCGTKERPHRVRVVLAHLEPQHPHSRSGIKIGARANHPQGDQHVCCDVSRGAHVAAASSKRSASKPRTRVTGHNHHEKQLDDCSSDDVSMIVSVPNVRERTIISLMTGPLRIRPMIQLTNMNAGPHRR